MAPVYLHQYPLLRHALATDLVSWRPTSTRTGYAGLHQNAAYRWAAQDDPIALGQEFGQVRVVRSCVGGAGQDHHLGPALLLYGVTRSAPSVPMSKRGCTLFPIRG